MLFRSCGGSKTKRSLLGLEGEETNKTQPRRAGSSPRSPCSAGSLCWGAAVIWGCPGGRRVLVEGGRRPSPAGVLSVLKEREPVRRVSGNWGAALELGLCLSTADSGRHPWAPQLGARSPPAVTADTGSRPFPVSGGGVESLWARAIGVEGGSAAVDVRVCEVAQHQIGRASCRERVSSPV